jgi:hypothetical protein
MGGCFYDFFPGDFMFKKFRLAPNHPKSTATFASGGQNPFRKMSLVICH